jgi:SAM-dependent methyltransferase
MREELEFNRAHWDEATRFHLRGNVYGVEDFKAGLCRLHRVEREEVGDVAGRRLLHLQCHFGIDTLSWARRGAVVTGVDFSPEAIAAATTLSAETGVPGHFVCSDVYALRDTLAAPEAFDIVYTSHGVLNWLPELGPWARTIAHFLAPGGFFYIVEGHPTARIFPTDEDLRKGGTFAPYLSYFHEPEGIRWPAELDYADEGTPHTLGEHLWTHSLSDIVGSLLDAGLRLDFLHEFPFCTWKVVAGMNLVESFGASHGYFVRPASEPTLPLMFSLRASKPAP